MTQLARLFFSPLIDRNRLRITKVKWANHLARSPHGKYKCIHQVIYVAKRPCLASITETGEVVISKRLNIKIGTTRPLLGCILAPYIYWKYAPPCKATQVSESGKKWYCCKTLAFVIAWTNTNWVNVSSPARGLREVYLRITIKFNGKSPKYFYTGEFSQTKRIYGEMNVSFISLYWPTLTI